MALTIASLDLIPSRAPAQWLLGQHPAVRDGVKRIGSAVVGHGVISLLLCWATSRGWIAPWQTGLLVAYFAATWGTIYALVRSGWSQRLADPDLTFVALLGDITAIVIAYGLLELARGAALQLLCLSLSFYMGRLTRRQILAVSFIAASMLAATLLGLWWLHPHDLSLRSEVFNLAMVGALLPIAGFVGGELHRLFQLAAEQHARLHNTLQHLSQLSTRIA